MAVGDKNVLLHCLAEDLVFVSNAFYSKKIAIVLHQYGLHL